MSFQKKRVLDFLPATADLDRRVVRPRSIVFQWYECEIVFLFALMAVFSATDYFTTSVDLLRQGVQETNPVLLAIATTLGMPLVSCISLTKISFFISAIPVSIFGLRTRDQGMKRIVIVALLFFTIVFILATANNLYWLTASQ